MCCFLAVHFFISMTLTSVMLKQHRYKFNNQKNTADTICSMVVYKKYMNITIKQQTQYNRYWLNSNYVNIELFYGQGKLRVSILSNDYFALMIDLIYNSVNLCVIFLRGWETKKNGLNFFLFCLPIDSFIETKMNEWIF